MTKKKETTPKDSLDPPNDSPVVHKTPEPKLNSLPVRIVRIGNEIYLDLGTADKSQIRITEKGWEHINDSSIEFCRPNGIGELPIPIPNGKLDDYLRLLNVPEADTKLVIAFQVDALIPTPKASKPILIIIGEQGTAKSSTARAIKSIIDPSICSLSAMPPTRRAYVKMMSKHWIVSMDNAGRTSGQQEDCLCLGATGGSINELPVFPRPQIITSISMNYRDDVLDRALVLECKYIQEKDRLTDEEFWRRFDLCHASTLGFLLDQVVTVLAAKNNPQLELPRMADFANNIVKCEQQLGWEKGGFKKAFDENREHSSGQFLSGNFLGEKMQALMTKGELFEGTASKLLGDLAALCTASDKYRLPLNARALSSELRTIMPALRKIGIDVIFHPPSRERLLRISKSSCNANDANSEVK